MSPSEVVHAQFDAYNAKDVEKMCSYYAEDCLFIDLSGATTMANRTVFRERFKTFAEHPDNRSWLANRVTMGNIVVDNEINQRFPGGELRQSIAIYTVRDGLIVRLAMGSPD